MLAWPSAVRGGAPLDAFVRLLSPEFRRLDDQRDVLARAPAPFRAPTSRSPSLGYHSWGAPNADSPRWVQVDLGKPCPIDMVIVVPALGPDGKAGPGYFFPPRFRIELADRADLGDALVVADGATNSFLPGDGPLIVPTGGQTARFVRFTATCLAERKGRYCFALGELLALSGALNVAAGRPVSASDFVDNPPAWGRQNLVDGQSLVGPPLGPITARSNGYHSAICATADAVKWVQVDLGTTRPLDEVRLIPARPIDFPDQTGFGFPARYRVEAANDADFRAPLLLRDETGATVTNPGDGPVVIAAQGNSARYVRVTATRLWERTGDYVFALAELQVYSEGINVARGARVTALDHVEQGTWADRFLVDGFASQYELLEWPDWAAKELARQQQEAVATGIETRWSRAREDGYHLLTQAAVAAGLVLLALAIGLIWRSRVLRRRETQRLRDRISRDLHDEVGSNLGSILLLSQAAQGGGAEQATHDLADITRIARQTADALRDLVWLLGGTAVTVADLLARLRETAASLLPGIEWEFDAVDDCLPGRPSLEFNRQVFLSFKEIVYNAARHSQATTVAIRCRREANQFVLEVADNGKGFDPTQATGGTGLRGLRARAAILKGSLEVESLPGRGTTVRLRVPV